MRWFGRRRRTPGHDKAVTLLHRLEHTKERRDKHDPNPNRDYQTPFDGGQYPGVNPRL